MIRSTVLLAAVLAATTVQAAGQRMVFVGCPILRDAAPAPCWLGAHEGQLYYLGPQGSLAAEFYPPQFNHRMLVEGELTEERWCGGIVLKHAKASVLPDIDPACNVMLPNEGYAEKAGLRGTGPSGTRGGGPETERREPRPAAPPKPEPPFKAQSFTATFDADTDRAWRPAQDAVTAAARYASAIKARSVTITGYRAAIRLSGGTDYVERADIAESRARVIETALRTVGLPDGVKVDVKWVTRPAPSTGTARDAEARRVIITVNP